MSDELPDRVRRVIDATGTRREFAARIGLDETKLSKALAGRRRFTTAELAAVAEHGAVDLAWLLAGDQHTDHRAGEPMGRETSGQRVVTAMPSPSVAPYPPRADPDGARKRILDAAWTVIAEVGYHRVRVSDVAAAAGTSSAAVHYHFDDKDALLTEALRHNVELAFDRQSQALADIDDAHQRLLRLLELQLPEGPVLEPEWSIWMQVWVEAVLDAGRRDLYAHAQDRWYRTVLMTLEDGARTGIFRADDLELTARQITGLVDGLGVGVMTRTPGAGTDVMRRALHDFIDRAVLAPGKEHHP